MEMASRFYVVGIGASAGGLEALEQFFKALRPVNNLAFVVIQHLSPDYKSFMPELISKFTQLKIFQIQNGMELAPGNIYVNPPRYNVRILDGRFLLHETNPDQRINQSVDIFFDSLANYMGEKSMGIILSGTGSDGLHGCRAIKEAGGIVIVQEESSARFAGMPGRVIGAKLYDHILIPRDMPDELLKHVLSFSAISPKLRETDTPDNMTNPARAMSAIVRDVTIDEDEDWEMDEIYSALIDECLPPSVLVDENGELIQVCGDAGKYLKIPKGRIYYHIGKMVPQELSETLVSAINKARITRTPVTCTNIRFRQNNELHILNLYIRPFTSRKNKVLIFIT